MWISISPQAKQTNRLVLEHLSPVYDILVNFRFHSSVIKMAPRALPPFKQKHRARTHTENRAALCAVCLTSPQSVRPLSANGVTQLQKFLQPGFSLAKDHLPTSICSPCRLKLSKYEKVMLKCLKMETLIFLVQAENRRDSDLPPYLSYDKLEPPAASTRSSGLESCSCSCCSLAGAFPHSAQDALLRKIFSLESAEQVQEEENMVSLQCRVCLTYIGRGKAHKCTKRTKQSNLEEMVKSTSFKTKGKVTSSCLKSIFADRGVSTRGGSTCLPTGSKALPVTVGTSRGRSHIKTARFSIENLIRLQTALNLSDRKIL